MGFDFAIFAGLALVLGVKHAFDADHLVAVSNLLTRRRGVARVLTLGSAWAAGHLATAAVVSALIYFFADSFLEPILSRAEVLVPSMLLLIGLLAIGMELRRLHIHRHSHVPDGPRHSHFHLHIKPSHEHGAMAGIGVVHGLASNDELLVVLLAGLGANAWWQIFVGVGLFSGGVFAGMFVYAAAVHFADARIGSPRTSTVLNFVFAGASIAYAVYLFAGGQTFNLLGAAAGGG